MAVAETKGHFIAHAIGGGLEMNIFSQARGLNRGISYTTAGVHQIARVISEGDYELLFPGTSNECEAFLIETVKRENPGLLSLGNSSLNGTLTQNPKIKPARS